MSVFKQRGFIRILRIAVIAAFALLLLVSLSRAEEPAKEPNQRTETQSSLHNSSNHMNHTDSDATDNAGHSVHIDAKDREGSVLPPNDGSVPDMSGHVPPAN